ncbi:superfamily II DNA/RNA helicase [Encephalitozoon hellem ATCC 50504]|uniref:Rad54-like protein n=1 Tax=Encephalitozoon hellem TaxID=27973 RepID=A0A9Q9C4E7_ENCHE|nr:superfamily II DNA/RNA helicase [Encephalitozoon hellem ATCC 50504]AFM98936.1 superfamily II DNA/RNA helicase [Encephalitozoon hellem ATCC 50504]UTX43949.1 Rad54-like protein [Encephalitozoon hellem]|eukprot:XP_003887917.1 superfamily II DNA/RNA helicase [Encephalitozoon hellem ATCC 50504]
MDCRAEDYEKSFVEKYLERTAAERIDDLLEKIEMYKGKGDMERVRKLEGEIEEIRRGLAEDKSVILKAEDRKEDAGGKESIDFEWSGSDDDERVDVFNLRCEKAIQRYCGFMGIGRGEFEEHLKKESKIRQGFSVPGFLWDTLFEYQKDGVEWMLKLYKEEKGGVLADDMGLGKTVQMIVFLSVLFQSGYISRVLILCPATIVSQWILEWKRFYPFVRVYFGFSERSGEGVYLMSYERFKAREKGLVWDILILDEGHKIKNRNAQITLSVKKVRARSKFVLSGTPIQNNLGELWSIFDFVNPGLLGSHTSFHEEFEEVIRRGGYRSASNLQVERAYKHSLMLRSLIEPYILRRTKSQISHKLPSKEDKIVFCTLTPVQVELYNRVLESKHVMKVLTGKANLLSGISMLRKVCNHPRLFFPGKVDGPEDCSSETCNEKNDGKAEISLEGEERYGLVSSSCKIKILMDLLKKWKEEGSKVLVFSQTIRMLDIIEMCIRKYTYLRMDGRTATSVRSSLVDRFNRDEDVFIFLLTTKVGGLGLNLIGASRIVIYDPDWNPSTDTQAKERAWRYGQRKDVEIYRFVCKDTIEEKVYQKQIFKDLLGKKVLSNPRLNRFFNKSCINELFSFTMTSGADEVRMHESHKCELEDGALKEVRDGDAEVFSRMKSLNEKKVLSGSEVLEYIRLRESG